MKRKNRGGWGALKADDGSKKVGLLALRAADVPEHLISEAIHQARLREVDDSTAIGLSAVIASRNSYNPEVGFGSNPLFLCCVRRRMRDERKKKARDGKWIAPVELLGEWNKEVGSFDEDELRFAEVRRAVKELSPEDQRLIALRFWEELSVPEIQNTKLFRNHKAASIRQRFHRAFKRLQKLLTANIENN